VTTRQSNVFSDHAASPWAIPRIYGATPADIEMRMLGVVPAIRHRGRRVVTV
jgi:hypothetical protein